MNPTIMIASANPGKIEEITAILAPHVSNLLSARDLSRTLKVKETGSTYSENARLKAAAYLKASGIPSLADDSGLEVDALDGAPGLYSARLSLKENATDADRRAHLLHLLAKKPGPWTAHFYCVMVIALPDGNFLETSGRCNGIVIPEERGLGGFGYDPIFYIPDQSATMAELPAGTKNKISHRARALMAMLPLIKEIWG